MSTTVEIVDDVIEVSVTDEVIEILFTCQQGPPGQDAAFQTDTDDITPSSTVTIASITLADQCAAGFRVLVIDDTNNLKAWRLVDAVHSGTSGVDWTAYARLGDPISYDLNVVDNGSTMDLELTNNGLVNLNTRVLVHGVDV
jgi:hypothetical protein